MTGNRQLIVAESGLNPRTPSLSEPIRELPLYSSLCAHSILQPDLFVVEDLRKDWRFANNPNVRLGMVFWASIGIRLRPNPESDETFVVGDICVIDSQTRAFTDEDTEYLRDLAMTVAREYELVFEQKRRAIESAQDAFVTQFISTFLSGSTPSPLVYDLARKRAAPTTQALSKISLDTGDENMTAVAIREAVTGMQRHLPVASVACVDLRTSVLQGSQATEKGKELHASSWTFEASSVLASSGPEEWQDLLCRTEWKEEVRTHLLSVAKVRSTKP